MQQYAIDVIQTSVHCMTFEGPTTPGAIAQSDTYAVVSRSCWCDNIVLANLTQLFAFFVISCHLMYTHTQKKISQALLKDISKMSVTKFCAVEAYSYHRWL